MKKVEVIDLKKRIKDKTILENISYTFEEGNIYGLYGRNGSGKTMLLRAIAGLIFPTEGSIKIDNKILHKDISFPPDVGVIIENATLLPDYNAFNNLKILSKLKKVASDDDIKNAIQLVGLDPESKLKVKKYSLGMKQRLNIAQAIFEKPSILLLDEPTNALDEESIINVRKILIDFKKKGAIIIIASHNKEDLNILADHVLYMNNGKLSSTIN